MRLNLPVLIAIKDEVFKTGSFQCLEILLLVHRLLLRRPDLPSFVDCDSVDSNPVDLVRAEDHRDATQDCIKFDFEFLGLFLKGTDPSLDGYRTRQ